MLYQTEQDDYVLLGENDCYDTSGTHQDEDKLYIAGFGVTLYKLNKEKTEKEEWGKELNLKCSLENYTCELDNEN